MPSSSQVAQPDGRANLQQPSSVASWHIFAQSIGLACTEQATDELDRDLNSGTGPYFDEERRRVLREAMRSDGYIEVEPDWDPDSARLERMTRCFADALDALDAVGLPANFLLVFDEVWEVVERLRAVLQPTLGHDLTFDFYVFNVRRGGTGWGMHRERAGKDAQGAFEGLAAGAAADPTPEAGAEGGSWRVGLPAYNTVIAYDCLRLILVVSF